MSEQRNVIAGNLPTIILWRTNILPSAIAHMPAQHPLSNLLLLILAPGWVIDVAPVISIPIIPFIPTDRWAP